MYVPTDKYHIAKIINYNPLQIETTVKVKSCCVYFIKIKEYTESDFINILNKLLNKI